MKKLILILVLLVFSVSLYADYDLETEFIISNVRVEGGKLLFEISERHIDNWDSSDDSGGEYYKQADIYIDYNLDALSNPVIVDTTDAIGGFHDYYTHEASINANKIWVAITHTGGPMEWSTMSNSATPYYFYTIQMDIDDPEQSSELTWDQVNTASENYVGETTADGGAITTFSGDTDITLPVELSTFTAQFLNGEARLYWVTQSEQDNIGWNVYRNTESDIATATQLNEELIPGNGTTTEPQTYNYTDLSLNTEISATYYYWIENLDLSGASAVYGPEELVVEPGDPGFEIPEDAEPGIYRVDSNPFRASSGSKVYFYLEQSSKVELSVYNIKGQLIETLHNGPAQSGEYIWNGTDSRGSELGTGVYLYIMKVDDKVFDTQKVILIK